MTDTRSTLRIALGAVLILGATLSGAPTSATAATTVASPAAAVLQTPDFVAQLGYVEGHLRVGGALYADGRRDEALVHFRHPAGHIYPLIAPSIAARGIAGFEAELDGVRRAAEAGKPAAEVSAAIDAVMAKLKAAASSVPVEERRDIHTGLKVASLMLDTIAAEYGRAITGGRITGAVGYQDSLGFMQVVIGILRQAQPRFQEADPDRWKAVAGDLRQLARAWPSLVPPAEPVLSADEVGALTSRLRLALDGF